MLYDGAGTGKFLQDVLAYSKTPSAGSTSDRGRFLYSIPYNDLIFCVCVIQSKADQNVSQQLTKRHILRIAERKTGSYHRIIKQPHCRQNRRMDHMKKRFRILAAALALCMSVAFTPASAAASARTAAAPAGQTATVTTVSTSKKTEEMVWVPTPRRQEVPQQIHLQQHEGPGKGHPV